MRKIFSVSILITLLMISGCAVKNKNSYLPESKNDKIYATVGGDEKAKQANDRIHNGDGYTLTVPDNNYRYEKDYDDGALEEKWEYKKKDDVVIKVTTYKTTDTEIAKRRFLGENDDYIFDDLTSYPVCGKEYDGDTLWFNVFEAEGKVYIVSWEYRKNTDDALQKELSDIAETFKLMQ